MHNCKTTREALLDLAFDEVDQDRLASLKAELNRCTTCRAEYTAFSTTRARIDQVLELTLPAEKFWGPYENRLSDQLRRASLQPSSRAFAEPGLLQTLRRIFLGVVRIPVPIAAILLLLFAGAVFSAFRSPKPQEPVVERVVETRNVEVPVIKERIVTNVVYVDRKAKGTVAVRRNSERRGNTRQVANETARSENDLTGFQPIEQVQLTVIKGNEK